MIRRDQVRVTRKSVESKVEGWGKAHNDCWKMQKMIYERRKLNTWRRKANNKWTSAAKEAKFVEPRSKNVSLYTKLEIFKEAIILSSPLFLLNITQRPHHLFTSHGFALSD